MIHLWPNGTSTIPVVTDEWGERWHPIYQVWRLHTGIDLVGFTYNRASAAGTVAFARYNGGAGNHVIIRHDDGTVTEYKHNRELWGVVGQYVAAGTILGVMGTTGDSTGVHLHFETRDSAASATRNPRGFIQSHLYDLAGGGTATLGHISESEIPDMKLFYIEKNQSYAWVNMSTGKYVPAGIKDSASYNSWARLTGNAQVLKGDEGVQDFNNLIAGLTQTA